MTPDKLRKLLRAGFWFALVMACVMAFLPHPPDLPTDRFGDKFNHILAFSTLAALASAAYPAMPRLRIVERLSFLGAIIEVVQSIPALHRDCDVKDWIADTVAVVVVVGIAAVYARRHNQSVGQ